MYLSCDRAIERNAFQIGNYSRACVRVCVCVCVSECEYSSRCVHSFALILWRWIIDEVDRWILRFTTDWHTRWQNDRPNCDAITSSTLQVEWPPAIKKKYRGATHSPSHVYCEHCRNCMLNIKFPSCRSGLFFFRKCAHGIFFLTRTIIKPPI